VNCLSNFVVGKSEAEAEKFDLIKQCTCDFNGPEMIA
jgi:hypothetical protein